VFTAAFAAYALFGKRINDPALAEQNRSPAAASSSVNSLVVATAATTSGVTVELAAPSTAAATGVPGAPVSNLDADTPKTSGGQIAPRLGKTPVAPPSPRAPTPAPAAAARRPAANRPIDVGY
ncbi:MAG TPA: hypothetical protein VIV60_37155, partial [Polyangiaceae bacterium]